MSKSVIFIAIGMFLIRCLHVRGISDLISICSPFILLFVHVWDLVLFFHPKCFSALLRINWTVFKSYHYLIHTPDIFIQSVCIWIWVPLCFTNGHTGLRITDVHSLSCCLEKRICIFSDCLATPAS